jgi:hypothetical protein
MIDGAEWFGTPGWPGGREHIGIGGFGGIQKTPQKIARDRGHIACQHQIPIFRGKRESGEHSAKRAFAGIAVGKDGITEQAIFLRVSHQQDLTGSRRHSGRHVLAEHAAMKRQQRLVPPHSRAAAAHQYVPRPAHTEMIPSRIKSASRSGALNEQKAKVSLASAARVSIIRKYNILRRFCFSFGLLPVVCGGLLNSSLQAADAITSVVRADPHSGKLVRVVLPPLRSPSANASLPSSELASAVDRIAAEHALPPELIHSVIKVESNYNPFAISPKGALGIMQLVPETARRFGVSNAFNPEENIQGGAKYLKYLLDLYHGDYPLALAAYNAGEGAVARHGGVPPYPETRNYVDGVKKQLEKAAAAKTPEPKQAILSSRSATGAEDTAPEYNPIRQIVEPDGSVRYVSR